MTYLLVFFFGLAIGSFVNALVWRVYQQEFNPKKKYKVEDLSIMRGRSMCPHCKHQLSASDLVPVFSWLALKGRCRYCKKPISAQYPIVELATAVVFVVFAVFNEIDQAQTSPIITVLYFLLIGGFMALFVFDLKWMYLPNRIIDPLIFLAILLQVIVFVLEDFDFAILINAALGGFLFGGLFLAIYLISKGKWIGGGDIKLGLLIGVLLGPIQSMLVLFLASLAGTVVIYTLMLTKKVKRNQMVPFGPFLIGAAYIVLIWGPSVLDWYSQTFLLNAL